LARFILGNLMPDVIVGTEAGLFRLGDTAATELEGRNIGDVAVEAGGWWVIADSSAVLHKGPGGAWGPVVSVANWRLNCMHPTRSGLLLGTDRAHLFVERGGSVEAVQGFEEAPGRSDWYTPWGGPPDVRSIAARDGAVYVNVHVGGILRSDDDGAMWSPTIDIHSDVHEVVVAGDGTILAATAYGLAVSRNDGGSWDFDDSGLHANYARAVAVSGDWVLLTTSLGPRGGDAGIFRRPLRGSGFQKIHGGLPEWFPQNLDTGCLAAGDGFVSLGTRDGRVFVSQDHGESWERIADGLPPVNKLVLEPAGP
jgi:photosystem II stability/assembly factor-like uncharacterized protein